MTKPHEVAFLIICAGDQSVLATAMKYKRRFFLPYSPRKHNMHKSWLTALLPLFVCLLVMSFSFPVAADRQNWRQQFERADRHFDSGNYSEALRLYEFIASETANDDAQFRVGWINSHGLGVPRNCREAARWYTLAAHQGNLAASNNLSVLYSVGCPDLLQNETLALLYLKRAADGGYSRAQANLSWKYLEGQGVYKNIYLAYDLAQKSASQSDPYGMLALATFYEAGVAVPLDHRRAVALLKQVANMEVGARTERRAQPRAQARLGAKYATGEGVVRDLGVAYSWYLLAAAGIDAEIAQAVTIEIDVLKPQLTDHERRQGEMRAQRSLRLSTAATVDELREALDSALEADRFEEGRYLAEALADQNDPVGQFVLGKLFAAGEAGLAVDADEAFIQFKRSCDGGLWAACVRKAYLLKHTERYKRLDEFLPVVFERMPSDTGSMLELAGLYAFLGEAEAAERLIRRVLIDDPENEIAAKMLGQM